MKKCWKNITQMLHYVHEASKFRILLQVVNTLLQSILPVWSVILIQRSIKLLTEGGENALMELIKFILLSLAIYMVAILYGGWYRNIYSVHSDYKIRKSIQEKVYKKIRGIDIAAFDDPQFYSIYTRAVNETGGRAIGVLSTITGLLGCISTFIGIISILVWLDPTIIAFVCASVVISILISSVQNKVSYKYDKEQTNNNREEGYIGRLFYLQQYAKEIKLFDLYNYFIDKFHLAVNKQEAVRKKYDNKFTLFDILANSVQIVLVFGIIVFLGWKYVIGAIAIADFATLLNASQELGSSIQQIFMFIPKITQHSFYIDNINEFLNYQSVIENNNEGKQLLPAGHNIEIKDLCFRYSDKSQQILNNIDLKINAGEKIAIVGSNGSGKTTLIKNILRLYDPTSGDIYIDGNNYKDYNVYSLRKRIGAVFQDFECYATTIADNVLLRPVKTEEDKELVLSALKACGLYEKVMSLKNGIFTIVTKEFDDEGVVFSGGELQKLAISRLFANDYDIIVMDEPSAALDPIAEYELNNKIMKLAENKTLIIVSHRLSTTRDMDRIVYMENGKIAEIGSHKSLMEQNGKYARLFGIQAMKYNE